MGTTTVQVTKLGFNLPMNTTFGSNPGTLVRNVFPLAVPSCPTPGGGNQGGSPQLESWLKFLLAQSLGIWMNTAARFYYDDFETHEGLTGNWEYGFTGDEISKVEVTTTDPNASGRRWGVTQFLGNYGKLWFQKGNFRWSPEIVGAPLYVAFPTRGKSDKVSGYVPDGMTATVTIYRRSILKYSVTDGNGNQGNLAQLGLSNFNAAGTTEMLPTAYQQGPFIHPLGVDGGNWAEQGGMNGADFHDLLTPHNVGATQALVSAYLSEAFQDGHGIGGPGDENHFGDVQQERFMNAEPDFVTLCQVTIEPDHLGEFTEYGKSGERYFGVAAPTYWGGFHGQVQFITAEEWMLEIPGQPCTGFIIVCKPTVRYSIDCLVSRTRYRNLEINSGPVNMAAGDTASLFIL